MDTFTNLGHCHSLNSNKLINLGYCHILKFSEQQPGHITSMQQIEDKFVRSNPYIRKMLKDIPSIWMRPLKMTHNISVQIMTFPIMFFLPSRFHIYLSTLTPYLQNIIPSVNQTICSNMFLTQQMKLHKKNATSNNELSKTDKRHIWCIETNLQCPFGNEFIYNSFSWALISMRFWHHSVTDDTQPTKDKKCKEW